MSKRISIRTTLRKTEPRCADCGHGRGSHAGKTCQGSDPCPCGGFHRSSAGLTFSQSTAIGKPVVSCEDCAALRARLVECEQERDAFKNDKGVWKEKASETSLSLVLANAERDDAWRIAEVWRKRYESDEAETAERMAHIGSVFALALLCDVPGWLNVVELAEQERDRLHIAFKRCQGALTDAGSVVVPDEPEQVEEAIRELTKERDRLREAVRVAEKALAFICGAYWKECFIGERRLELLNPIHPDDHAGMTLALAAIREVLNG